MEDVFIYVSRTTYVHATFDMLTMQLPQQVPLSTPAARHAMRPSISRFHHINCCLGFVYHFTEGTSAEKLRRYKHNKARGAALRGGWLVDADPCRTEERNETPPARIIIIIPRIRRKLSAKRSPAMYNQARHCNFPFELLSSAFTLPIL